METASWALLVTFIATASAYQTVVQYLAESMVLKYKVLNNLQGKSLFTAEIVLHNNGNRLIEAGNWTIYSCQIRLVEPDHIFSPEGAKLQEVRFRHIAGCLFAMEPLSNFQRIEPGKSKTIRFKEQYWSVSRFDVMPNWYVASGDEALTISSTAGEKLDFVGDFRTKEQRKRYPNDQYHPFSPKERYNQNNVRKLNNIKRMVIPTPYKMYVSESSMMEVEAADWIIVADKEFTSEAKFLHEKLSIKLNGQQSSQIVKLTRNNNLKVLANLEAYKLRIKPKNKTIFIEAVDSSGMFNGIQTLLSLWAEKLPEVYIMDFPRYSYRSMHLDVGRNFHTKEDVLKLLESMAMYKLNKFHFHLSDDEGWRLELPSLPELTQVGSKRCYDMEENRCLISQLGSGPTTDTSGSGFYSTKDYQEILQFAKTRHIEVVPEFDMPGHSRAAIKSMEVRYKHLANSSQHPESLMYLLTDRNDTSRYLSIQMFDDNAINPCIESTYNFIERILSDLVAIHKNVSIDLKKFHFGGDEIGWGAWVNSSDCARLINNSVNLDLKQLQEYFVHRVANITSHLGLDLVAWEDGLISKSEMLPFPRKKLGTGHVFVNVWNNVWEWGTSSRAYKFANLGYKVVMSQATHLYFDHPYEPDPEERGFYWATRFTDTRKIFGFSPENLYAVAEKWQSGKPIRTVDFCGNYSELCTPLLKPENIVGMQGNLWTETVRTSDQLQYMIFPRLLALAERAWHKASWENIENKKLRNDEQKKDWERFANVLGMKEFTRLDKTGIKYRIPLPGAIIKGSNVLVNTAFPGLKVESSQDKKTWKTVTNKLTVTKKETKLYFRTKSADEKRTSRIVSLVAQMDKPNAAQLIVPINIIILLSLQFVALKQIV